MQMKRKDLKEKSFLAKNNSFLTDAQKI